MTENLGGRVANRNLDVEGAPWVRPPSGGDFEMRLFCFPYAGGTTATFLRWTPLFPVGIQVCPVGLPGRGQRIAESSLRSIQDLAVQCVAGMAPLLDAPFALLGHSFGAILAFEVARQLRRLGAPEPLHLFASAIAPPHRIGASESFRKTLSSLTDDEFMKRFGVLALNGDQFDGNRELAELMLPPLRADSEALANYAYREEAPLTCGLSTYIGSDDPYCSGEIAREWKRHTDGRFELRKVPGGHWFIDTDPNPFLARVRGRLSGALRSRDRAAASLHA